MSERERLEREVEELDQKVRAALREENAAAREAEKFATTKPLDPTKYPEPLDEDARSAAFKRKAETEKERIRLMAELDELRKRLDLYD